MWDELECLWQFTSVSERLTYGRRVSGETREPPAEYVGLDATTAKLLEYATMPPINLRQTGRKPDVNRAVAVVICVASAMACLVYDHLRSGLPDWWRGHGGGVPYVVFWIAFCFVIFPFRRSVLPIAVFVTTFTCILEFMQLWKPPWLMELRATRLGAALLGSGFTWHDFPPYFIGGVIGYLMLMLVCRAGRSGR